MGEEEERWVGGSVGGGGRGVWRKGMWGLRGGGWMGEEDERREIREEGWGERGRRSERGERWSEAKRSSS